MNKYPIALLLLPLSLASCVTTNDRDTIAGLRNVTVDIKEERITDGLDKAMANYQRFLEETPESAFTPEAIRRLADLKIEKDYGQIIDRPAVSAKAVGGKEEDKPVVLPLTKQDETKSVRVKPLATQTRKSNNAGPAEQVTSKAIAIADIKGESLKAFEKRTTRKDKIKASKSKLDIPVSAAEQANLQSAGTRDAIKLYKKLLAKFPLYERNDQVLYQMSRAYEELGKVDVAIGVLNKLISKYPKSRHIDEAQFRRAEYYFTRKKYLDAEDAYKAVLKGGKGSNFYELALYKLGWTFFKQDLYEDALHKYIALMDHKLANGYNFEASDDKIEKKRVDDTFRVISLSFSYLGGADAVVDYFKRFGTRSYEVNLYSHLGEYYLSKRRYSDAANAYNTFVKHNPTHKNSPYFSMHVIEIYKKGGFPKLVIEEKRNFATTYGLKGKYWAYYEIKTYPEILAFLKTNLVDLGNHYHSQYQKRRPGTSVAENFREAAHWYKEYRLSFPQDEKTPGINYQLAELYLENKNFRESAAEFERTAYQYPEHKKSSEAGYAAVYAYREYLKKATQAERGLVKREIIRSSLRFAETYPKHKKASAVLVAATVDLYEMKDYKLAIKTGRKIIANYPDADKKTYRPVLIIIAHASFDLTNFKEAEEAYIKAIKYVSKGDQERGKLQENLAASIYKQGEQASKLEDHKTAAEHYLRIAKVVPTASIRPTAEYDGAAALISLKDWGRAASVLEAFRKRYPRHKLQHDVTKKMAVIYKEDGRLMLAAAEFERIEKESKDDALRREALLQAAEIYEEVKNKDRSLIVYQRYVRLFPKPLEFALDTRYKIAEIYKAKKDNQRYFKELKYIIKADASAGRQRTDRTRYLAGNAALVFAESSVDKFKKVKLKKPFKKNLLKKKKLMKAAIARLKKLVKFEVGNVTAAVTFNIAEIYFHFSKALMESERPTNLNAVELEQYNLVLEEQAFPFEEKAIKVHEKNMELLATGIYNPWIDQSLSKLAVLMPARYGKAESNEDFIQSIVPYGYADIQNSNDNMIARAGG